MLTYTCRYPEACQDYIFKDIKIFDNFCFKQKCSCVDPIDRFFTI